MKVVGKSLAREGVPLSQRACTMSKIMTGCADVEYLAETNSLHAYLVNQVLQVKNNLYFKKSTYKCKLNLASKGSTLR